MPKSKETKYFLGNESNCNGSLNNKIAATNRIYGFQEFKENGNVCYEHYTPDRKAKYVYYISNINGQSTLNAYIKTKFKRHNIEDDTKNKYHGDKVYLRNILYRQFGVQHNN